MERYKEYKDSGVQWLGKIPSHWKKKKMKYCFKERSEKNHPDEPVLCATQSQGVIPQSMYANRVVVVNKGFEGLKLVKEGDFVISLRSFEGGIEYAYYQGIISAAYTVLEPNNPKESDYWKYLFKSQPYIQLLQTCVTGIREGQNINYPLLGRKMIPIPPLDEQKQIVSFIESKTSKIDEYISEKEKEVQLLNELKEAEIAKAVTQGLNPNVKMKDSGISWIGMIPEHWEVRRLSQVAYEHYISNKEVHHQNLLSLSYGRIIRKDINTTEGLLPASFDTYQIVEEGNIVMRLTDLQNDHKSLRVGLVKEEGIVTSAYVCLGVSDSMVPSYLYNILHSYDIKKLFYSMGGGLRQNLNWQGLKKLDIPLPPIDEQQAIVAYINDKTAKVESLITDLQAEIEHLKEYKQRLIADCVTGQVNVQNE
jgi:type I restriction enzyme S subunit